MVDQSLADGLWPNEGADRYEALMDATAGGRRVKIVGVELAYYQYVSPDGKAALTNSLDQHCTRHAMPTGRASVSGWWGHCEFELASREP
jgi:hypothetical protein